MVGGDLGPVGPRRRAATIRRRFHRRHRRWPRSQAPVAAARPTGLAAPTAWNNAAGVVERRPGPPSSTTPRHRVRYQPSGTFLVAKHAATGYVGQRAPGPAASGGRSSPSPAEGPEGVRRRQQPTTSSKGGVVAHQERRHRPRPPRHPGQRRPPRFVDTPLYQPVACPAWSMRPRPPSRSTKPRRLAGLTRKRRVRVPALDDASFISGQAPQTTAPTAGGTTASMPLMGFP